MSGWAALILGVFLVAAAVLHGGVYSPGHDFVVNRFTGSYEFVPADEEDEASRRMPIHRRATRRLCLDASGTGG